MFETGENAGAAIGQWCRTFDADATLFDREFNQLAEAVDDGDVVARLLRDQKLHDFTDALLVKRAVWFQAGAEIPLGALAGMAIDFHGGDGGF